MDDAANAFKEWSQDVIRATPFAAFTAGYRYAEARAQSAEADKARLVEASKSALLVLSHMPRGTFLHPNFEKDLDHALEGLRAAIHPEGEPS